MAAEDGCLKWHERLKTFVPCNYVDPLDIGPTYTPPILPGGPGTYIGILHNVVGKEQGKAARSAKPGETGAFFQGKVFDGTRWVVAPSIQNPPLPPVGGSDPYVPLTPQVPVPPDLPPPTGSDPDIPDGVNPYEPEIPDLELPPPYTPVYSGAGVVITFPRPAPTSRRRARRTTKPKARRYRMPRLGRAGAGTIGRVLGPWGLAAVTVAELAASALDAYGRYKQDQTYASQEAKYAKAVRSAAERRADVRPAPTRAPEPQQRPAVRPSARPAPQPVARPRPVPSAPAPLPNPVMDPVRVDVPMPRPVQLPSPTNAPLNVPLQMPWTFTVNPFPRIGPTPLRIPTPRPRPGARPSVPRPTPRAPLPLMPGAPGLPWTGTPPTFARPDLTPFETPGVGSQPQPQPKPDLDRECPKPKGRKGQCRQGYFRETATGITYTTWSTRKCPSSKKKSRLRPIP